MVAQRGLLLLILRGDAASPEVFTAAAGLRSTGFTLNGSQVDVTSKSHVDRWRRQLAGAGVRSLSMSGGGVFEDDAVLAAMVTDFTASPEIHSNYQVVVPGLGTFQGSFQITTLGFDGEHDGEVSYNLSLENSGAITFTAAA